MPRVQFVGQSERDDDNRQGNTSRLLNMYRERLGVGGKSSHVLKSVLGTTLVADLQTLFPRDMAQIGGRLYIMAGDTLFDVRQDGGFNALTTSVSAEGAMIFGAESGRICQVTGGRYFVWDGVTNDEPTAGAFSAIGSGAYFNNYVLLSEANGRRFQWSDLADAKTLPGLNFASAESTDSAILRIVPLQGRVWIMKEDVIEQWYATGQAGANAFARLAGGVEEVGLKARGLVARFTGGVFFVGNDDITYISNGGAIQPVSGPAVNTSVSQSTPTDCFVYEDEGHKMCVIRFSDRPAWCYDIVTGEWHERASGEEAPWAVTVTTSAYGEWYGCDVTGKVLRLDRVNNDAGQPLIRTATSSTLYNAGNRFVVAKAELTARMGLGNGSQAQDIWSLVFPDGREFFNADDDVVMSDSATFVVTQGYVDEPSVLVAFSGDGGRTWSRERERDLGAIGEFDQLCRFHALGSYRQFAARVRIASPQDVTIDAEANVEVVS